MTRVLLRTSGIMTKPDAVVIGAAVKPMPSANAISSAHSSRVNASSMVLMLCRWWRTTGFMKTRWVPGLERSNVHLRRRIPLLPGAVDLLVDLALAGQRAEFGLLHLGRELVDRVRI